MGNFKLTQGMYLCYPTSWRFIGQVCCKHWKWWLFLSQNMASHPRFHCGRNFQVSDNRSCWFIKQVRSEIIFSYAFVTELKVKMPLLPKPTITNNPEPVESPPTLTNNLPNRHFNSLQGAQYIVYIAPSLTIKMSAFRPMSLFICFLLLSE